MIKSFTDTGKYSVKDTGEVITYEYEYIQYTSIDGLSDEDIAKVISLANRQAKVDANNITREKTKTANGHSERPVLTEEQKLANKERRQVEKQALSKLKGLDPETLAKLGIVL